jgi:predicted MFS family arabinose efflux permease
MSVPGPGLPITPPAVVNDAPLARRTAALLFLSFAFAYFFSALVRGVTATLAPEFSRELGLNAGHLGLLAGAYFFGFAVMQLPLGGALDRFGPRRVLLAFIGLAVLGCVAFALARSFAGLTLARSLIGMGVSACLMGPMTTFRRRFGETAQMRANSWMLMTGSLGMVASTLPVQWLLPLLGWRGLFWALALFFALAMLAIAALVPEDAPAVAGAPRGRMGLHGYRAVFRHPSFVRFAPMALFHYGAMVAVQSLWAGPWLSQVGGLTPAETARGLFGINVAMLLSFMGWGLWVPRLYARGFTAQRLIAWGAPLSLVVLLAAILLGRHAGAAVWGAFCVSCTVVALSQPAVGQAFPAALAGRALSAYNLVIFVGVFLLQWGLGLAIDAFKAAGWSVESSYRGAFALLAGCCALSYVWFLRRDDGIAQAPR